MRVIVPMSTGPLPSTNCQGKLAELESWVASAAAASDAAGRALVVCDEPPAAGGAFSATGTRLSTPHPKTWLSAVTGTFWGAMVKEPFAYAISTFAGPWYDHFQTGSVVVAQAPLARVVGALPVPDPLMLAGYASPVGSAPVNV